MEHGEYLLDNLRGPALKRGRTAGQYMAGGSVSYQKPLVKKATHIGVLVMGDKSLSMPRQDLILQQDVIRPTREDPLTPHRPTDKRVTSCWLNRKGNQGALES